MSTGLKNLKDHGFETNNRVYVIAEIGINHGGDIKTAKVLLVNAIKGLKGSRGKEDN